MKACNERAVLTCRSASAGLAAFLPRPRVALAPRLDSDQRAYAGAIVA